MDPIPSNHDESESKGVILTQSELIPEYISSLDFISKALEDHIADLELCKSRIMDTFERYMTYIERSQEQQISWHIFNQHIDKFQRSFLKLLEFIDHKELTHVVSAESLKALAWSESRPPPCSVFEGTEIRACHRFLQYNPDSRSCNASEKGAEDVFTTCATELVGLVRTVCQASKTLATAYWDEQIQIVSTEERSGSRMNGCRGNLS